MSVILPVFGCPESTEEVQATSSGAGSRADVFVIVTVVLFGLSRQMTLELCKGIISNYTHALGQATLLLPLGPLPQQEALPVVLRVPDDELNDSLLRDAPFLSGMVLAASSVTSLLPSSFSTELTPPPTFCPWSDLGQQRRGFPPGYRIPFSF